MEVINGCSLQSLQERLDSGNLPAKEVERAKSNNEAEFPDGIPECGSDALRFGLLAYTVQGRDINLDVKRVVGYRLFCNKLWNATIFALKFLSDFSPTATLLDDLLNGQHLLATRDKFMISRLTKTIEKVNECFTNYKFGDAQQAVYSMWIDDLCDVYLELIKPIVKDSFEGNKAVRWTAQATLWILLESGLRLLHPMMPFVTEELWQRLPGRGNLGETESQSIMISSYPEAVTAYKNDDAEASMNATMIVIRACRSLRASYNIPAKVLTHFFVKISGINESFVLDQIEDIKTLAKGCAVDVNKTETDVVGTVIVDDTLTVLMDVKGLIDYKVEISRLQKNLQSTIPLIEQLTNKVMARGYEANVPVDLKSANRDKLDALLKKKVDLEEAICNLKELESLDLKQ